MLRLITHLLFIMVTILKNHCHKMQCGNCLQSCLIFHQQLIFPAVVGDGNIISIVFFRRLNDGFTTEQLSLFSRMQMPLIAIIESLSANEKRNIANTKNQSTSTKKFKNIIGSSSSLLNVLDLRCAGCTG